MGATDAVRGAQVPPGAGMLDAYEPLEVIGNGTFGIIRKVRRRTDGALFARKELNFERMSERDRRQIVSEVNILRTLHHANVVRYEERFVDTENGILYIVMELCEGGDLGTIIKRCRRGGTSLPEETVWAYFAQMAAALDACHNRAPAASGARTQSQTILHRDLKPENVFLDLEQNVKLGDFGLSKQIGAHAFANTFVGTPYYMSPELATGRQYDTKSDIWALGCIVYELCALSPPFDAADQTELTRKIKLGCVPALPRIYSRDLQEAVSAMLQLDPRRRPTTRQLLQVRQIKFACRAIELAEMHRRVAMEGERIRSAAAVLQAREDALAERERAVQDTDSRSTALALAECERVLAAKDTAHAEALAKRDETIALQNAKIEQLSAALEKATAAAAAAASEAPRPRRIVSRGRSEFDESLRMRIADGALGFGTPQAQRMREASPEGDWEDEENRAAAAEPAVPDCSMRDASHMWRTPVRLGAEQLADNVARLNVETPVKEKRQSLPSPAKETTLLPRTRTEPNIASALPQEPQWHLCNEEERPSPFLKRVNRIPLDALGPRTAMLKVDKPNMQFNVGSTDQENVIGRRRAIAERRRRSSLVPPAVRCAPAQREPLHMPARRLSAAPASPARLTVPKMGMPSPRATRVRGRPVLS